MAEPTVANVDRDAVYEECSVEPVVVAIVLVCVVLAVSVVIAALSAIRFGSFGQCVSSRDSFQ